MTKTAKAVKAAQQRSMERALREERLALAAIVKVMLIEVPDPARVLARLDAMTRAAESNPRTPRAVVKQLLDATLFVKTAIERETGRPQSLFDPHVGHVKDTDVDKLVEPTNGPQQLGLQQGEGLLGDAEQAHEERVATINDIHQRIVGLLERHGRSTDRELHALYLVANGGPPQTLGALGERRRELVAAGRIVAAGRKPHVSIGAKGEEVKKDEPAWDLVERAASS